MPYILIIESKEARSGVPGNHVVTKDGDKFIPAIEPDGWVEATSHRYTDGSGFPSDALFFETREGAEKFGKRWKGHPWWCVPKSFEVVEVKPKVEQRRVGWKRA